MKPTIEQLKEWEQSGRTELAAQMSPETVNDEDRTIDCIWFTGPDVARYSWIEGPYMLRFDPKGADLSNLNNGAPVLDNHWSFEARDQKGKVEKAWAESGLYKATLRFSKRPEVEGLWQDLKDKIVTKFSMGVEILEMTDKRDKDGQLQLRTATKWRPYELSIAPIPADFGTTTLSAQRSKRLAGSALCAARLREIEILRLR